LREFDTKKERKLIIAGNWKMNKTVAGALDLVRELDVDGALVGGASLEARSFAEIIKSSI
jgi:triosephosphate isomerase